MLLPARHAAAKHLCGARHRLRLPWLPPEPVASAARRRDRPTDRDPSDRPWLCAVFHFRAAAARTDDAASDRRGLHITGNNRWEIRRPAAADSQTEAGIAAPALLLRAFRAAR